MAQERSPIATTIPTLLPAETFRLATLVLVHQQELAQGQGLECNIV